MAYSVWICAQAMPQRGHDLWGDGTGEGKEKGLREARVMAPLRSELTGEFRPEHGRKELQTQGSLWLHGRSQAPSQVLWVTCLQHDGLQMMPGASVLFPDQAEDQPLWMGYV